jgi:hypothetical protein
MAAMLAASCPGVLNAGERSNVQGMGMGRTAVAAARGLDAVGSNPANLLIPNGGTVSLSLGPFGAYVGSDFMSLDLYNKYFTGTETDSGRVGRYLTHADKRELLDAFPGSEGELSVDAEVRGIGLSLQLAPSWAVGFTITERMSAVGLIPRQYAEFILYGNLPGTTYDFSATSGRAVWLREYAVSAAMALPAPPFVQSLQAGVTAKLVHGYGYFEMKRFQTTMVTSQDGVLDGSVDVRGLLAGFDALGSSAESYTLFPAPAGSGVGFDLGAAADVTEYVRAGLSITDIGSVTWERNVEELYSVGSLHVTNPLDEAQRDSLEDAVAGEQRPGDGFSRSLPTALRMGVAVQLHKMPALKEILWGEWMLAMDYHQSLVPDAPGAMESSRFSMGLEFKPWGFLPLRAGFSYGGSHHLLYAFGFGFHLPVVDIDFASENIGVLLDEQSPAMGSLSAGIRITI